MKKTKLSFQDELIVYFLFFIMLFVCYGGYLFMKGNSISEVLICMKVMGIDLLFILFVTTVVSLFTFIVILIIGKISINRNLNPIDSHQPEDPSLKSVVQKYQDTKNQN